MSRHVERVRHQMFNDSTNAVKESLKKLMKGIEDFLLSKADEVFLSVKRDYESVVLGRQTSSRQLPREQRQIRTEVNSFVEETEMIFREVVGVEPKAPKPPAAELDEKEMLLRRDRARPDAAVDDVEQVETNKGFKPDDEDNVFNSAIRFGGTTTRTSLIHQAELETAKNDSTLASAEVGEDQGCSRFERTKPPTEASAVLEIPIALATRTAPPEDLRYEHNLENSHSLLSND